MRGPTARPAGEPSVLIADDEPAIRMLVRATIASERHTVLEAADGDAAWALIRAHRPDVVVLDVRMPGRTGLDLARAIRAEPALAGTRVILLTGSQEPADERTGLEAGADLYLTKPFSPRELLAAVLGEGGEVGAADADPTPPASAAAGPSGPQDDLGTSVRAILEFLDLLEDERVLGDITAVRRQLVAARDHVAGLSRLAAAAEAERRSWERAEQQQLRAVEDFRRAHDQARTLAGRLDRAYLDTITTLARAIEARDGYTGGHVERVRRSSLRIAQALGLGGDALRQLEFGAVLHDVGKIGVPDAILVKAGPLDPDEWRAMRAHPEIGRRVLEGVAFLAPAVDAVAHHHERWDGKGYPDGLAAGAIPLAGRVVAVADAYDAMATNRPYRTGLPVEVARAEIERGRGSQFDPDAAEAFLATSQGGA